VSQAWEIGLQQRRALDGEAKLIAAQSRAVVEGDQISRAQRKRSKRSKSAAPGILQSFVPSFLAGAALAFFLFRSKRKRKR